MDKHLFVLQKEVPLKLFRLDFPGRLKRVELKHMKGGPDQSRWNIVDRSDIHYTPQSIKKEQRLHKGFTLLVQTYQFIIWIIYSFVYS